MPTPTSPLERSNGILRAFGAPFRLRQHRRSRWVTIYEILPDRRTRERSYPGCAAADPEAVGALCERLLEASKRGLPLDAVTGSDAPDTRRGGAPCWAEICDAVVGFQRGQGVNMNLVGPFKGQGYFRLLPQQKPACLEDVRRFALHTSESLKAQLQDPSEALLPMATHRQGFRQKREVVSLLRRAGFGAIAPKAKASKPLGRDDQRFSPVTIGHLTHRLVEVKQLLDQLTAEQKELHETLRIAHLRGDLLHLVPPGQVAGTYQLPEGPTLHRRAGRKQWHYSEVAAELEAQLKARQVYEQTAGVATTRYGASFWELRFPKG